MITTNLVLELEKAFSFERLEALALIIDEAARIAYGPRTTWHGPEKTLPALDESAIDRVNALLEKQKALKYGAVSWYAIRLNTWLMCRLTDPLPITHQEALSKMEELLRS